MKKILSLISLLLLMVLASCSSNESGGYSSNESGGYSSNELVGYWLIEGGKPGEGLVIEFDRSGNFKAYEIDDGRDFVPFLFMTANYKIDGPTIKFNNVIKQDERVDNQTYGFTLNEKDDELTIQSLGTLKKMTDSEVARYLRR